MKIEELNFVANLGDIPPPARKYVERLLNGEEIRVPTYYREGVDRNISKITELRELGIKVILEYMSN